MEENQPKEEIIHILADYNKFLERKTLRYIQDNIEGLESNLISIGQTMGFPGYDLTYGELRYANQMLDAYVDYYLLPQEYYKLVDLFMDLKRADNLDQCPEYKSRAGGKALIALFDKIRADVLELLDEVKAVYDKGVLQAY